MPQPTNAPFAQHAASGTILRLALVNGLLNLITLSWWRFWGNTRVRRLLWSHTTAWGEPLEYTGTGKELFLGFLVVLIVVLAPLGVAFTALQSLTVTGNPLAFLGIMALQIVVLFLAGAGLYRARRYRLSRTLWRGIRGGQDGSAWVYGLMVVAALAAGIVTLGWAWPWAEMRLERYKLANTTFGDRRFECEAKLGSLYLHFGMSWLIAAAMVGLTIALAINLLPALAMLLPDAVIGPIPVGMVAGTLILVVALFLAIAIPFAMYRVAFWRQIAANTRFAGVSFAFAPTSEKLLWLGLGNWLLTSLTLGLLRPVAAWRTFRFACQHLRVEGEIDFAAIAQGAASTERMAEGLAAAFDGAGAL